MVSIYCHMSHRQEVPKAQRDGGTDTLNTGEKDEDLLASLVKKLFHSYRMPYLAVVLHHRLIYRFTDIPL